MKTKTFDDGIQVVVADEFNVSDTPLPSKKRSGLRFTGSVTMPAADNPGTDDIIVDALRNSGMEIVRSVELQPGPTAITRSAKKTNNPFEAEVVVNISEEENAVVLFEQDGMYLWKYGIETKAGAAATTKRGDIIEPVQKRLVFQIEIASQQDVQEDPARRGLLKEVKEFAWGKIKAYILKFAAAKTVQLARNMLEKNITRGIVHIVSPSPESWKLFKGFHELPIPQNKKASLLLLVHGTFSSTIGAYGAIGETPWGKSFLQSSTENYDAVFGFNHATLSEDPLQNAKQLLDLLEEYNFAQPPVIDVVAHSRGGLVIRSLIEKLLPTSKLKISVRKVIFVGCTNGGTLLAEPTNWGKLINLYTNLTAGACRVVSLIAPQSKIAAVILSDIIKNVGSFVKYCAEAAISDRILPGLAAMEPDGDFVKDINQLQPGQPEIADTFYCAVTSAFKPRLTGGFAPKELPRRFLHLLAGGFMNQLVKENNDLVVNTSSMDAIDLVAGSFVKDRYDFGENPQVYHTNYFTRPEVMNALTTWLNLTPAKSIGRKPNDSIAGKRIRNFRSANKVELITLPQIEVLTKSVVNSINLNPAVDTDIVIVNATANVGSVWQQIDKKAPSYVVVRRSYNGEMLNYAFKTEEALDLGGNYINQGNTGISVLDAFNLHETDASANQDVSKAVKPQDSTPERSTKSRNVVLVDDKPVGVIPEKMEVPGAAELASYAKKMFDHSEARNRILYRRTMPTFRMKQVAKEAPTDAIEVKESCEDKGAKATQNAEDKPAHAIAEEKTLCHFHAEMDAEVVIKRKSSIVVTISRETLEKISGTTSVVDSGAVVRDKPLLVRVLAKSKFIVEDQNDGQAEVGVPAPGHPTELYFDLRAADEEGEGEVWVLIRQGAIPVVKLVLKPKAVRSRSRMAEKVAVEKSANEPKPLVKPLNHLWIEERKSDKGFFYNFRIYTADKEISRAFNSEPVQGDRQEYIANLYKKIEDRWLSSNNDLDNFQQELRAYGADLFDELIPAELKNILWRLRNNFESMLVMSSEPFIPWELIHLREPGKNGMPKETLFLAQMGLVRWLEGANENGWPKDSIKVRQNKARYVIPRYPHPDYVLPEAELEARFLEREFNATAITPESGNVRNVISDPGSVDLLHFACHGVADEKAITEAGLLMEGREENGKYILDLLTANVTEKFCNLADAENQPLVVLNACQAGRAGYKLTGIGGFAKAFLYGGAAAFIGTLWSVGDSPARTFTETLYKALLDGKDLSVATVDARNAAKKAGEATWLAYVVYGHPHMTLKRE